MDKKTKIKPQMKKDQFKFTLTEGIEIILQSDMDRFSNGFMIMVITEVKISDKDGELGNMRVDARGSVIQGNIKGRSYTISMKELWPLFEKADELYLRQSK